LLNKIEAESFPSLEIVGVILVQDAFRTPNWQDQKINIPECIIIKTQTIWNNKENNENRSNSKYKSIHIRIIADF
jgi:hypothetical protein